jgi:hypothetical protein
MIEGNSLEELADTIVPSSEILKSMSADGVKLERLRTKSATRAFLVTTDPDVASKYDMHDESEFLFERDDESEQEW